EGRGRADGGRRVAPQPRAVRVVALEQLLAGVERHRQADVAAAAREVVADDSGQLVFETVAFVADAHMRVDLDALEIALQDEVGDTGNRVSTIRGRCAAGDDLDPLERGRRDRGHVDGAVGV